MQQEVWRLLLRSIPLEDFKLSLCYGSTDLILYSGSQVKIFSILIIKHIFQYFMLPKIKICAINI